MQISFSENPYAYEYSVACPSYRAGVSDTGCEVILTTGEEDANVRISSFEEAWEIVVGYFVQNEFIPHMHYNILLLYLYIALLYYPYSANFKSLLTILLPQVTTTFTIFPSNIG